MKKILSISLALVLAISLVLSLAGCSKTSAEMTDENIRATVDMVETALKEFDINTLEDYVDSATLNYIIDFAKKHDQYAELGKAIFKNLELDVEAVDVDNQTVTIHVKNKNLAPPATAFADELMSNYSKVSLVTKLDDDEFLDSSLNKLVGMIDETMTSNEESIDLTVKRGNKNLVLLFTEPAENAVSGGALGAITSLTF